MTAGKVRYIGLSDVPAWVSAEAQTIAQFRGWTPVTALQLEYSLLERTPEGELLPMAEALGIGVLPWSPLRGGQLSGKYVRNNGTPADSRRTRLIEGPTENDGVRPLFCGRTLEGGRAKGGPVGGAGKIIYDRV